MTTDTAPNAIDPKTLAEYEPPVEGESQREKRNRKARNRRAAERHQRASASEASTSTSTSTSKGRPSNQSKRAASVTGIVTGIGIGVMMLDEVDGTAIIEGASDLGDSLAAVADKSPKVARALDALAETSAWGQVATAVLGIAAPIAKNHGFSLSTLFAPKPAAEPKNEQAFPPAAAESNTSSNSEPPPQVSPDAPVFAVDDTPKPDPVPTFRA